MVDESASRDPEPSSSVLARRDVTRILQEWRSGDTNALERLTPYVYDELRRLARGHMTPRKHQARMTGSDC